MPDETNQGSQFAPIRLTNRGGLEYSVEPSGVLRIDPSDIRAQIAFDITYRSEDKWYTLCRFLFRLADANGRLWEAGVDFPNSLFVEKLIDLSRREPAHFEAFTPEPLRQAVAENGILTGCNDTFDDRFRRYLVVDDMAIFLRFKYQGMDFDVGVLEEKALVVKESGCFGSWNRHYLPAPGELPRKPIPPDPADEDAYHAWLDEHSEGEGDYDHPPPIYFGMKLRDILTADRVYRRGGGELSLDGYPAPLRFRSVEGQGGLQPAVTFQPARSAPPGIPGEDADTGSFVPIKLEDEGWGPDDNPSLIAFPTTEGGDLLVPRSHLEGAYRLGFKERGPARDVLSCVLRVPDETGQLWEAETLFTPEVFLERLVDLDRRNWPVFVTGEPQQFRERSLLTGIRDTLDDHGRRLFMLASAIADVTFDSQKPVYDVAEGGSYGSLLVRVWGLTGRSYLATTPDPEFIEVDVNLHTEDEVALPPIVFEMAPRHLAFRNTTFATEDGFRHDNELPIPLVFRKVPGQGAPQKGVVFLPHGVA